jgi:hypothetical protein
MRHLPAMAVALGVTALALPPLEAAEADATPGFLTDEELNAREPGSRPVILRGSAMSRKPARAVRPSAERWQVAAGRRLWLIDPVNEEVRACAVFNTPDIGVQDIDCVSQSTSGFARTFGPAFNP